VYRLIAGGRHITTLSDAANFRQEESRDQEWIFATEIARHIEPRMASGTATRKARTTDQRHEGQRNEGEYRMIWYSRKEKGKLTK